MKASSYIGEAVTILSSLDRDEMERLADELKSLRERKGRLFIIGLGGSAANASHAVNDFRKLCAIEAYAPTDNVAELTARANDEGFNTIFFNRFWEKNDSLLVLSVGGGALNVSFNICLAIDKAKEIGMPILGIVGRDGGYTKLHGDAVVVIPPLFPDRVTPHTESFQSVILHYLVTALQITATKW